MDRETPAAHRLLQLHLCRSLFLTHRHYDRRLRAHHLETLVEQETRRGSRTGIENVRQYQETGTKRCVARYFLQDAYHPSTRKTRRFFYFFSENCFPGTRNTAAATLIIFLDMALT